MTTQLKYILLITCVAWFDIGYAQTKQKSLIGETSVLSDDDLHKTFYCGNTYTYFAELDKTPSMQVDQVDFIKQEASANGKLPKDYSATLQKKMENAAARASQSILPCPEK